MGIQLKIARAATYRLAEYMIRFWLTDSEVHREHEAVSVQGEFRALGLTIDRLVSDLLGRVFGETDKQAIENQFRAITSKISEKRRVWVERSRVEGGHYSTFHHHGDVDISHYFNR